MSSVDVCVRNPVTHNTWDNGRYITYEIAIKTSNCAFSLPESITRRRYSEFEWLKKRLRLHHPLLKPPPLPPKKIFGDRFDADFVAFRMKGLENFLIKLLDIKLFMSDALLHLFLQSDLTCKDIDDVMEGKMGADVIDHIWQSGGIKENCRDFNKNAMVETKSDERPVAEPNEDEISIISDSSVDLFTDSNSSSVTEEEFGSFPPLSVVLDNSTSEFTTDHVIPDGGASSSQIGTKNTGVESGMVVDRCSNREESQRQGDMESDSDIEVLGVGVSGNKGLTHKHILPSNSQREAGTQRETGTQQTQVTGEMNYSINGDLC